MAFWWSQFMAMSSHDKPISNYSPSVLSNQWSFWQIFVVVCPQSFQKMTAVSPERIYSCFSVLGSNAKTHILFLIKIKCVMYWTCEVVVMDWIPSDTLNDITILWNYFVTLKLIAIVQWQLPKQPLTKISSLWQHSVLVIAAVHAVNSNEIWLARSWDIEHVNYIFRCIVLGGIYWNSLNACLVECFWCVLYCQSRPLLNLLKLVELIVGLCRFNLIRGVPDYEMLINVYCYIQFKIDFITVTHIIFRS